MLPPSDPVRAEAQRRVGDALALPPGLSLEKLYAEWLSADKALAESLFLTICGELVSLKSLVAIKERNPS